MKKIVIGIIIFVLVISTVFLFILLSKNNNDNLNENNISDSEKFANEYNKVSNNNVFVYKSLDEINNILKNGTGIVYLGFPECPWCQEYVKYLNEEAISYGVEKIFYFNILEDRKNNTIQYQETVKLLEEYLQYDDEGNKKIYVPAVISVNNGKITGFDDETSWDTKNYKTPEEYWENEDLDGLKSKLNKMFDTVKPNYCTSCN